MQLNAKKRYEFFTIIFLTLGLLPPVMAATTEINGVRIWPAPENTRVVFDLSEPANYKLFHLDNPSRLVLDIKNARLNKPLKQSPQSNTLIKKIRTGERNKHDLRIVLDLSDKTAYKSFLLEPYSDFGDRLVLDLIHKQIVPEKLAQEDDSQPAITTASTNNAKEKKAKVVIKTAPQKTGNRDLVIAIDAGHGGMDPGAKGYRGTYEKDVVYQIARKLETMVRHEPGLQPLMIRDGDYFMSLRERTKKARQHNADFFVSIHADAFKDHRVHGMSVYALSQRGASSEAAKWLAEKENASDLVGGVSLDDKDNMLASVLLDLSQTATIEASFDAGSEVLKNMAPLGKLHKKQVQQAGFVVLKSPDIPSILIETAYISNPDEEYRLRSPSHQTSVARSILAGIRDYFSRNAPPGTLLAARKHIIAQGDTLSDIAQRYQVSIASLRTVNSIEGDKLLVGKVLRIPVGKDS